MYWKPAVWMSFTPGAVEDVKMHWGWRDSLESNATVSMRGPEECDNALRKKWHEKPCVGWVNLSWQMIGYRKEKVGDENSAEIWSSGGL